MHKLKPNQFTLSGHLITERPILFQTEMVQANLEDRKTQTRREVKNVTLHELPFGNRIEFIHKTKKPGIYGRTHKEHLACSFIGIGSVCPYGKPGDLLWVRETWAKVLDTDSTPFYAYKADFPFSVDRWKPSIHMPKSAARLWLMVEDIRVERLQDIIETDAMAEGIKFLYQNDIPCWKRYDGYETVTSNPVVSFWSLWASINGEASWEANPWVWVVQYRILSKTGRPEEKTILHHFLNIVKGEKKYMTI